jgi:flagellar basal body-associated protein FliL
MVKKATLDLLAEKGKEEGEAEATAPDEKEGEREPVPGWFTRGRIIAVASAGVMLLCVVVFSVMMHSRGKTVKTVPAVLPKQAAAVPTVPAVMMKEEIVTLKGFVIHLTDGGGNYRTLLCDIALVLNDRAEDVKKFEQRVDVRNLIYATAKSKGASLLDPRNDRNVLRREINDKVNGLVGGNKVKSVYFTEFLVL